MRVGVTADQVVEIGLVMGEQAQALAALNAPDRAQAAAFGNGAAGGAAERLLGNWTHERLVLSRALDAISRAAVATGGSYLEVETAVTSTFGGPTP